MKIIERNLEILSDLLDLNSERDEYAVFKIMLLTLREISTEIDKINKKLEKNEPS